MCNSLAPHLPFELQNLGYIRVACDPQQASTPTITPDKDMSFSYALYFDCHQSAHRTSLGIYAPRFTPVPTLACMHQPFNSQGYLTQANIATAAVQSTWVLQRQT